MRSAASQHKGNNTAARLGGYSNRVCAAKINVAQIKIHWKPLRAGVRGGEIISVADQSRRLAPSDVSYILSKEATIPRLDFNRVCAAKINVVDIKIPRKPLRAGVRGGEILQVADQSPRLAPTTVSYIPNQGNDIAARLGGASSRAYAALITIAKINSHRKPPRAGVYGGEFSKVAD
ncbi:hypothetical protein LTS18_014028 [Coniosporium uncinatum]|uniref:Uncharacterized protein n=1 Tax=Coniosporium uncinatum TaxID=93489 RepID=A0ACC3D8Q9_9PEZI|nr:hypothetical protein LTS18_014028 [Coniosporium uncinatum]